MAEHDPVNVGFRIEFGSDSERAFNLQFEVFYMGSDLFFDVFVHDCLWFHNSVNMPRAAFAGASAARRIIRANAASDGRETVRSSREDASGLPTASQAAACGM